MYKHWGHEGGIGTPLIVHWPKTIERGRKEDFTNQYGFLQDIMATAIDVAHAEYPKTYHGQSITPLEGRSMLHVLQGNDKPIHEERSEEHTSELQSLMSHSYAVICLKKKK